MSKSFNTLSYHPPEIRSIIYLHAMNWADVIFISEKYPIIIKEYLSTIIKKFRKLLTDNNIYHDTITDKSLMSGLYHLADTNNILCITIVESFTCHNASPFKLQIIQNPQYQLVIKYGKSCVYYNELEQTNNIMYFKYDNEFHRLYGPAIVRNTEHIYYRHGWEHNRNGPSYISKDKKLFKINGKFKNIIGPAIQVSIKDNQNTIIGNHIVNYDNNKLHCTNGPAIDGYDKYMNRIIMYYVNNKLDRYKYPAFIHYTNDAIRESWHWKGTIHRWPDEDGIVRHAVHIKYNYGIDEYRWYWHGKLKAPPNNPNGPNVIRIYRKNNVIIKKIDHWYTEDFILIKINHNIFHDC